MDEDDFQFTRSYGENPDGDTRPASEEELNAPETIGRYRVDRWLGSGGFGAVYLGFDLSLNRPVAIKVPHQRVVKRPADVDAYLNEARTVANLDHSNIVPVYDVGSTDEFPCFIVSKYVEGANLANLLKQQRLSIRESAELVATVAEALHYAHKQGLVHRDIKPSNIMVDLDNKPFVVDFGLALRDEDIGKGPGYVGTVAFMSPEQARGEGHRVDGRSDIFSLGVVFYFLLVGRRPFRADSASELMTQISSYEARPLRQYDDSIPKELERICSKAIAKRASERYSTAQDFAADLRLFLNEYAEQTAPPDTSAVEQASGSAPENSSPGNSSPVNSTQANSAQGTAVEGEASKEDASGSASYDSASRPVKIIPKGLRSFDSNDYDFFLELIPGPRDRDGMPDVIRFWKTRIEETDGDLTFPVGLIYGPSGCGKSSLVKAGLLPRLSENVVAVYLEASPDETESRILNRLRKMCPALDEGLDLRESIAALRRGQGLLEGKKVVIVVDQFEQWLHATADGAGAGLELVQAFRQCDGGRVQCVLLVRDDFWMAVTRFLGDLEVELVQGHNFSSVDLFPIRHAQKVLTAFGRAFGAFENDDEKASKEEKEFIKRAVAGLAEDEKVICVRLALFAEMMKSRPWTMQSLKQVGGTKGVGFNFLEETFGSHSNPKYRLHQKAARAVLQALLPETGTNIKGQMKSQRELLAVSGYANRPKDFAELMKILDGEIRLVTPTDPEGDDLESEGSTVREGNRYYQLTHDYLVHSLRDWLTRKAKESRRGRAKIRLQELAATWNARPENRYLPSGWDFVRIRLLTQPSKWTEPQSKMMQRAGVVHGLRSLALVAGLLVMVFAGLQIRQSIVAQQNKTRVADLVDFLAIAESDQVDPILRELQEDDLLDIADPLLQDRFQAQGSASSKLNLALALLPNHPEKSDFLVERIPDLSTEQFFLVCQTLDPAQAKVDRLWTATADSKLPIQSRFQAAVATAVLSDAESRWAALAPFVAGHLTDNVPAGDLFAWMKLLEPRRQVLATALAEIVRNRDPDKAKQREVACVILREYWADQPAEIMELLLIADELHEHLSLFEGLKSHAEVVVPKLVQFLNSEAKRQTEEEYNQLWKSKSIAAIALVKLNHGEEVWPHLKHSPDPSLRSYIVRHFKKLRVDPSLLLGQSKQETEVSIRRALILGAGYFLESDPPAAQWIEYLQNVYANDDDPGVHGAAAYTLRRWKVALPELPNGIAKIPADHLDRVRAAEKEVDYAQRQVELAIQQLPGIRRQWEAQFLAAKDDNEGKEIQRGLVSHFLFDENDGHQAINAANSTEPGNFSQTSKPDRTPGIGGNAIRLDGNQSIVAGKSFNPDVTDSFSMGCWVYFDDETQVASILSKMGTSEEGYRGFDLWLESGRIGAHFKHEYPVNMIKTLTSSPIGGKRWRHVFVVYDGSNSQSQVSIFVDGRLTASDLLENKLTGSFTTNVPWRIGSRQEPQKDSSFPFAGLIDDVRIFDRALSPADVRKIYLSGLRNLVAVPEENRLDHQSQVIVDAHRQESKPIQKLKLQHVEKVAAAAKVRWSGRPRWYLNQQNQTMVVIPRSLQDGQIPIPYDFAIGAHEVTVADFKKRVAAPGFLKEVVPTEDCPAHQLNWFDAAKYCNWLTEQDPTIPNDQVCYEKNANDEWGPGVKLKANYEQLSGYRLPTTKEWEFAARAFSRRQYYFGESAELLDSYGWYASNSKARTYPVGSLLPNDFGLFDMQGNVWEWILDKQGDPRPLTVDDNNQRRILGGGFNYLPSAQRSENSFHNLPDNRVMWFGFRVVRILPVAVDE